MLRADAGIDENEAMLFLICSYMEQMEEVSISDATLLWFIDCRFWKLRKLEQDREAANTTSSIR